MLAEVTGCRAGSYTSASAGECKHSAEPRGLEQAEA